MICKAQVFWGLKMFYFTPWNDEGTFGPSTDGQFTSSGVTSPACIRDQGDRVSAIVYCSSLHPWKLTNVPKKGTISVGNTAEPTIDFQGTR